MEIICGINSVHEAIKAGKRKVISLYIAEGKQNPAITEIANLAQKRGIKIKPVAKAKIFELTHVETNQGIAAEVEPFKYLAIEELINLIKSRNEPAFIIILDQVNDPHNLGAIIRTAHQIGAHGVIIPKDNSADISATVIKAASGAAEHLPIVKVTNLNNTINLLKDNNIWVVGAEGESSKTIYDYDFTTGTAIVLGGEGKGLRRLVKENCDELLTIPMKGKIDSFNVSVAGAIFMAEVMRQRSSKKCAKTT
ncbi:MAG: 23S rRNA (guanosine(2251)-2'-O)-methyltransferase RlmB [Deltaproteobacteria bacterium]|nr:23S rRNA (guanosine(2251)-2'-O)-methyltransferase RlmB [Deltaproteobacteria bacterium]